MSHRLPGDAGLLTPPLPASGYQASQSLLGIITDSAARLMHHLPDVRLLCLLPLHCSCLLASSQGTWHVSGRAGKGRAAPSMPLFFTALATCLHAL